MLTNNNIKNLLNIKLNNKTFIKNYKNAVINFKEFVKYENIDNNLVKNAIDTNDIGILQNTLSICQYEKLIEVNNKFKFI